MAFILKESIQVYRVAIKKHIDDREGSGAKLYGGRWNLPGMPLVYTAQSISLAVLESSIPVARKFLKDILYYVEVSLPKGLSCDEVKLSQLSKGWRKYGFSEQCIAKGQKWAKAGRTAVLKVPSAAVKEEHNYLINPNHDDFKRIVFTKPKPLDLQIKV